MSGQREFLEQQAEIKAKIQWEQERKEQAEKQEQEDKEDKRWRINEIRAWITLVIAFAALAISIVDLFI